ncbi:hypothetical protein WMY93_014450 [Mugilogobius chulae]|uniref:Uncharacterized protein n=1 Tax=Mugilogobius chulae TaxID=88201 RepID=A0AAW0NUI1_9GOBI
MEEDRDSKGTSPGGGESCAVAHRHGPVGQRRCQSKTAAIPQGSATPSATCVLAALTGATGPTCACTSGRYSGGKRAPVACCGPGSPTRVLSAVPQSRDGASYLTCGGGRGTQAKIQLTLSRKDVSHCFR